MKFSELSNKDRYRIIRMGVQNGIHSVSDIEHIFDEGGHLYDGNDEKVQQIQTISKFDIPVEELIQPQDNTKYNTVLRLIPNENEIYIPKDEAYTTPFVRTESKSAPIVKYLSKKEEEKIREEENKLKNLKTKDDVRKLQKELADSGYYDSIVQNESKTNIKQIQQKLKDKGLYDGEIDGIVGKKTIKAFREYNIDGIIGGRTKTAFSNKLNDVQNEGYPDFKYEGNNDDKGCAEFITKQFNRVTGVAQEAGVTGDAWRMLKNIEKKGGDLIYNIFDDSRYKEHKNDVNYVRNLIQQQLKENSFDIKKLKPGDVVGLYNPNSPYQKQALQEGTTYNTHVGIVVGYDDDGMPLIQHNLHNPIRQATKGTDIHTDRADNIFGKASMITSVARPKFNNIKNVNWDLMSENYSVEDKYKNEDISTFSKSMAGFAPVLKEMYPDVDNDLIQQTALGILKRETLFMNNTQSKLRDAKNIKSPSDVIDYLSANLRKVYNNQQSPLSVSSDKIKMKMSSLTPEETRFLGINSPEDLNDPKKAAAAMTLMLSKYYEYFDRYKDEHPQLDLTEDDVLNLTIKSYNVGFNAMANIGYDSKTGKFKPEEIINLRNNSDTNKQIADYNSTNYHRVFKNFESIDNILKDRYKKNSKNYKVGYVGSARKAMQENIVKNI